MNKKKSLSYFSGKRKLGSSLKSHKKWKFVEKSNLNWIRKFDGTGLSNASFTKRMTVEMSNSINSIVAIFFSSSSLCEWQIKYKQYKQKSQLGGIKSDKKRSENPPKNDAVNFHKILAFSCTSSAQSAELR